MTEAEASRMSKTRSKNTLESSCASSETLRQLRSFSRLLKLMVRIVMMPSDLLITATDWEAHMPSCQTDLLIELERQVEKERAQMQEYLLEHPLKTIMDQTRKSPRTMTTRV